MSDIQVVIIEPEYANQEIIKAIIKKINPDIETKIFESLKMFFDSYKKSVNFSSENIPKHKKNDENHEDNHFKNVKLIIADIEATYNVDQNLWKKFLDSQKNSKEKNESPPRFLYTSYDKGEFDPYKYRSDVVYNILIKPLDDTLVEQIVSLALQPEGPLEIKTLYSQKQPGAIELIKDIEIERLTELGFRTKSRRPIEINKIARYFGDALGDRKNPSMFAYCYANYESDKKNSIYSSSFSYFGISKDQLASIRRLIQSDKSKTNYPFVKSLSKDMELSYTFIILSKNLDLVSNIQNFILDKFLNINILVFSSLDNILQQLPPSVRKKIKTENKSESKTFEKDEKVIFSFNENFSRLIDICFENSENKVDKIFNFERKQWIQDQVFNSIFYKKDMRSLTKIFEDKVIASPQVFELKVGEVKSFIKFMSIEESFNVQHGKVYLLRAQSLNEDEEYAEIKKTIQPIKFIHGFFIDDVSFKNESLSAVKQALELISNQDGNVYKTFVFSDSPVDSYSRANHYQDVDDVFQIPLDVFYLTRKLKMHCESLELKNPGDNSRLGIELRRGIKTAWPLTIDSVSEVHISFKYPRQIQIGDVRRLILPLEAEANVPEVLAICRYCEKLSGEGYRCDFLFFAVKDAQLKHIRQWIKKNYIDEKSKTGA